MLALVLAAVCAGALALFSAQRFDGSPGSERGFVLKTYIDPQGEEHQYLVFVPYDYKRGQKRPLLLFLNGMGENGTDGVSPIKDFWMQVGEMKRSFPFVVAIPQCRPGPGWTARERDKALGFLDQVAADYDTDPDRVYVTGLSSGGTGVWNLVASHPGRFAAAVPLCGHPAGSAEAPAQAAPAQVQIWNFYNEKDAPDLVESNRRMRQELLEAGGSPLVTEYPLSGHACWGLAYRCTGMYDWLLEQSRSHNARQTRPFELLAADRILSTWQSHGPARWTAEDARTIACRNAAADQPGYVISRAAYAACEFHVDVYLESASQECQLGLFEQATDEPLSGYVLHVSLPDAGSGGLAHSTDGWIAALDPAAQRQLRTAYWNDVRLHFGPGRITARINGWKALDVHPASHATHPVHVALGAARARSAVRWRNLRVRELDHGP